jgi:hypothetical protein
MPMEATMLGDGDVLGDGITGPQSEESMMDPMLNTNMMDEQTEVGIRNELLTEAYGTKIPQRRGVEKEN